MIKNLILTALISLGAGTPLNANNTTDTGNITTFEKSTAQTTTMSAIKETGTSQTNNTYLQYSNYARLDQNTDYLTHIALFTFNYYKGVKSAKNKIHYAFNWLGNNGNSITSYLWNQGGIEEWSADVYITDEVGASQYNNENYSWKTGTIQNNWWNCKNYCNNNNKLGKYAITTNQETEDPQKEEETLTELLTINIELPTMTMGTHYVFLKLDIYGQELQELLYNTQPKLEMSTRTINNTYEIAIDENVTYEVLDIAGLMLTILAMPWNFISQAFNLTLFSGTPYAVNLSNLFKGILAICAVLFIIKLFTSGFNAMQIISNSTEKEKSKKEKKEK